jgi:HEAT repeat protein
MERDLQKISAMLQSPDGMRRCAAAMVLTELAPQDAAVVKALGESLANASQLLTRYVLEAFEAIGTRAVVPYVLPLLNAAEVETKLRAVGILARAGGDVLPLIEKQFAQATPQQRLVLADVLARIHSSAALAIILDMLFDSVFELVKEVCQAVRRHIADATPKQREALHKTLTQFMVSTRVKENDRVLTSCLLLVGYIGAPEARKVLLQFATPKHLGYIRRNALLGLKGLEITGPASAQTIKALLPCLNEEDPIIAQHALDIIERLPETATGKDAPWRKLLQNSHAPVRACAAQRLAALDDAGTNKLLLDLLAHEDPQVSDIAAGALAHHDGATRLLLDILAKERDAQRAWRLVKILKPHGPSIDKKLLQKFADLAGKDLAAGQPRYEALLYLLRNTDPKIADAVLLAAGQKFQKTKQWPKAIECYRQLANSESFDNEIRYDLSLCNLKQSPKDLSPHLRSEDHALRGFHGLLANKPFKLLDRLQKETTLDAPDFCYLGFHFAEQPGPDDAAFGRALLDHLAKKWPKSPEAKSAKNKLKLAPASAAK